MREQGVLYLVSTPIGNLGDITRRAVETLREVDLVYAEDTRRTGRLAGRLGLELTFRSLHEHNEAAREAEILSHLEAGRSCALVSDAGTPAVSDPGARLVNAVTRAGHRVVPVPGPSALLAALVASGLPTERFAFLGFPPRGGTERERWMEEAGELPFTVVAYESPLRLVATLREWVERGLGDRPAAVCRELTKRFEETVRGTVRELAELYAGEEVRGEVTIVLGGAGEAGWEVRRAEAVRLAEEMLAAGRSSRDIVRRLTDELGVPRNEAYAMSLAPTEER